MISTNVNVRVIDIGWLLKDDKDFLDLALILKKFEKDNLFRSKLVIALTHEYWTPNLKRIIRLLLVPWALDSLLSTIYFSIVLQDDFHENNDDIKNALHAIGAIVIILTTYQFSIEYR